MLIQCIQQLLCSLTVSPNRVQKALAIVTSLYMFQLLYFLLFNFKEVSSLQSQPFYIHLFIYLFIIFSCVALSCWSAFQKLFCLYSAVMLASVVKQLLLSLEAEFIQMRENSFLCSSAAILGPFHMQIAVSLWQCFLSSLRSGKGI